MTVNSFSRVGLVIVVFLILLDSFVEGLVTNALSKEVALATKAILRGISGLIIVSTVVFHILVYDRFKGGYLLFVVPYFIVLMFFSYEVHPLFHATYASMVALYFMFSLNHYEAFVIELLKWFVVFNGILILLQFIGGIEMVYYHQLFSMDSSSDASFLQEQNFIPDQQLRPFGIFSNTIYVSVFQLIGLIVMIRCKERFVQIFIGLLSPFLGSFFSVITFFLSLLYLRLSTKIIPYVFSYLVGLLIIYLFFEQFFKINYDLLTFSRSVDVRVDDGKTNSLLQILGLGSLFMGVVEALLYSALPVFVVIALLSRRLAFYVFFSSILILPLLHHPIMASPLYVLLLTLMFHYGRVFRQTSISGLQSARKGPRGCSTEGRERHWGMQP